MERRREMRGGRDGEEEGDEGRERWRGGGR